MIRELRMRKDAAEVDELRAAGAAIDRVHARMGEFLKAGRTEAQVGADIAAAIVEEGHTVGGVRHRRVGARTGRARTTTCPTG